MWVELDTGASASAHHVFTLRFVCETGGDMPNWNSKTKKWSPVRQPATQALEAEARRLRKAGVPVKEIAARLGRTVSRVREYVRPVP